MSYDGKLTEEKLRDILDYVMKPSQVISQFGEFMSNNPGAAREMDKIMKEFFKDTPVLIETCDISDAGLRKWRDEAIDRIRMQVEHIKMMDFMWKTRDLGMIPLTYPDFRAPWGLNLRDDFSEHLLREESFVRSNSFHQPFKQ
jgi:hypothetical protein